MKDDVVDDVVRDVGVGGAQGLLGGMQALAAGIMAPVTGWVYENHGQQSAYWLAAIVVFSLVVIGLLVAGPARTLRG